MNKQTLKWVIYGGLFLIPFIPFLVSSSFFFPFITSKAFAFRILVEIVFFAWLVLAYLDPAYRPRRSLIMYCLVAFLVIIGLADLLGVAPGKSFWSNYERMEGYITLLHLGALFLVASATFSETVWRRWWNTSLSASFIMVLYSLSQVVGVLRINQGGARVDGTFGNASYLAVYMLFHIFIALYFMYKQNSSSIVRWAYGFLIFLQTTILYHTATRGAILGLLGGLFVIAVLNLRNPSTTLGASKDNQRLRKVSIIFITGLVVLVGGFFLARNTSIVEESPVLARFASISSEELKGGGRSFVWPMAIKGIAERPFLGWGQDNFNYVFNKHYSPEMYRLEPWFDRAHNIFLDWGVAGGVLGLLAYLSLYFALLYLVWRGDQLFSYTEKSILTGLVSAYFFHNLFVFDHLVSYILFFALLAYVHSRSLAEQELAAHGHPPAGGLGNSRQAPVLLAFSVVALVLVVYFVNVRPMRANTHLISALITLQTGEYAKTLSSFEEAYKSRLGRPEVVEQVANNAVAVLSSGISTEDKNAFYEFARRVIITQADHFSDDARYQIIAGSFLTSINSSMGEGLTYLERARELSPGKQQIYYEIGAGLINQDKRAEALSVFRTAYELAPENPQARAIYLVGAIYAGDRVLERELLALIPEEQVISNREILSAYVANGRTSEAVALLRRIGELDPSLLPKVEEYIREISK